MSFLVLAFPALAEGDFQRIQAFRKNYDPFCSVVDPHFTLVFPVNEIRKEDFISEIKKQSKNFQPFEFIIQKAIIHKDELNDDHYIFLLPEKGWSNFIEIHDQLYSGLLKDHLRRDIEFIPHITIVKSKDKLECDKIAHEWNCNNLSVEGRITHLTIAEYQNDRLVTLQKLSPT